jgi:spermidine/putrescine transport system ATP-binding protein
MGGIQASAEAGAGEPAGLRVEEVRKSFGPVEVLGGVSIAVRQGAFTALVGPSGCGKTTLLRIIAGLELADAGRVVLSGRDITALPANQRPVNIVFQSYALFPHLDVYENVAFGLRSRKFPRAEIERRLEATLQMLRLQELSARRPHQLSGGEKQRVALARALVNEPDLLLLDEPMSALDAKLRAEVQLELRSLQRRLGKTFLLVTHDQDEAMTVSDRLFVMRQGRIEQAGPPAEVYDHPVNRFVAEFLGVANLIPARRVNGGVQTPFGRMVMRTPPPWESGTLAIRPEGVRLCAQAPEVNGVRARVRETVYRGDHVDLFVEPGGLRVRTPDAGLVGPGSEVWVQLPPERLEVLVD